MNHWDQILAENESDAEELRRDASVEREQEQDAREFVAMAVVGPTVDIAVYEQAVKGRREFRAAYRAAIAEQKALREQVSRVEALCHMQHEDSAVSISDIRAALLGGSR